MLNSIDNTALVRCREVVRFSEGPLSEGSTVLVKVFSHKIDGHTQLLVPSNQKVFCANLLFPMVHFLP